MQRHAIIIGGGMGGLTAACELALNGFSVELFEAQQALGGKMAERSVGGQAVNIGPSVLTLRHVFDELFARAGRSLSDAVPIRRLDEIGRHYFTEGGRPLPPLDLYADRHANADAIGVAFGQRARTGYLEYAAYCERMWTSASDVFVFGQKPSLVKAAWTFGRRAFQAANEMDALRTMHDALLAFFPTCRPLRQLFGRYATYAGSSPFAAPATLHLVSHVEQLGSWSVQGGLVALGQAVAKLASELGVKVHLNRPVHSVLQRRGRACGVVLHDGSEVPADIVVFNGDSAARTRKALWGTPADDDAAGAPVSEGLSGMVTAFVGPALAQPLKTHTIFFGDEDERAEYRSVLNERRIASKPNIYLCAQDRAWADGAASIGSPGNERLFALVNAPPSRQAMSAAQKAQWEARLRGHLASFGLELTCAHQAIVHEPAEFATRFYGSDGVLYGRPAHAWRTFFDRPSSRSKLKNLYLAGGTVHPGPGVPMAAVSGILAARAVSEDFRSTSR